MPKFLLGLLLVLMLTQCATKPETTGNPALGVVTNPSDVEAKQTVPASITDPPHFREAQAFDRFLTGALSKEEIKTEKQNCKRRGNDNPFCYTWERSKTLERLVANRNLPPVFPEPKVVTPIPVEVVGNKIKNFNKIRKEKIPQLLKGVADYSLEQIRTIAKLAQKSKACPNNLLVVAAATMEDHLPDNINPGEIADLYEKGARCTPRFSTDREHFYTRAGLLHFYARNYSQTERLLAKVRAKDAYSGRAIYWRYRAQAALGNAKKADRSLRDLFANFRFSFHTLVAALEMNRERATEFLTEKPVSQNRSKRMPVMNRMIAQVEVLKQYQFGRSASLLVEWALDRYPKTEPQVKVYMVGLAEPSLQVPVMSDILLRKPNLIARESMQLLYPRAFGNLFDNQRGTIDPYLLMAVARKESRFDPNAVSIANAQGLLQIQPATAHKVTGSSTNNLLDPETNISIAAKYLNEVLGRMDRRLPLALASYNAGEEPVGKWTKRYLTSDTILFIDLMPYRETRDYVGYVLSNYYWYRKTYDPSSPDPLRSVLSAELAKK